MFEYKVIRSKRKSISIEFDSDLNLLVRSPLRLSEKDISKFLIEKKSWIDTTYNKLNEKITSSKNIYEIGGSFLFLGKRYTISQNTNLKSFEVVIDSVGLFCFVNSADPNKIKRIIDNWLLKKTKEIFNSIFEELWNIFSLKQNYQKPTLALRSMKTQWGNLSHRTKPPRLTLNKALIHTSRSCIESVVMHEFCHLVFKNHQKDFYNLLLSYMPDYKVRKKELEKFHIS